MKIFGFILALCFSLSIITPSLAQSSGQKEAANMAILYAVLSKKMNDEDIAKDLDDLRNDTRFNKRLQEKLDKLTNSKSSNSKDKQVRKILEQAGKDIDRFL